MTRRERVPLLEQKFAMLCERILSANGYEIELSAITEHGFRADTVVKAPDGQRIVVETRLYRSPRISSSLIENAIQQLLLMRKEFRADKALLITTLPGLPSIAIRPLLAEELEFWDIQKLTEMVASSREL